MRAAAYTGTRNVYEDMETAAKSLVANSNVERVHFFIEDGEFPHELPDIVETHDVSAQRWFPSDGANSDTRWTYMTLLRTALCYMLPDARVLSMDIDTICTDDVSGVFDIDLSGSYFAATPEKWAQQRPGLYYCNVGVSLMNLDALRYGKADEIIGVLNAHRFGWPDQDALNYLCQGRIAHMPSCYNSCPWVIDDGSGEKIVHYAARNDYHKEPLWRKWRDTSWPEVLEMHEKLLESSRV